MGILSAIGSAAGGIGALGAAIYGGVKSAKYNKKASQLIEQQRNDNREWYNTRMAEDYTQRSDVQAAVKRQRELLQEQYENARRTSIVSGATDEALAQQQAAANASLSDTMTDMASQAADYKDSVEQQYRSQDAALNQQQAQTYQQQAQQTAQAAGQAVNAGVGLLQTGLSSITKTKA